uniref:Reverse transcriptase domain-containing protein n=1 Tax=Tanacetum cinerariifolium TaxID=118510 RepID=A0A6L2J453_TANCI|nr:reverse transcriptase domain-containing protein [Tanacetum cinerariifolium]
MFKQLYLNITLAEALVLMPKYHKMLKALLSNKEKLQELANTPLNENCSAVILKKLPEKLGDPGRYLIPCGFSLPDLILTRMTLELANRAICTPDGIARDVFVPVGKFTFPADFVVVDYESDPRVPLILGRPFLRTIRALIDVNGEEMILRDGDERLTLNMKHDTASYSNHPHRESVNFINIFNVSSEDYLEEFTDELALITYPLDYDDNIQFDIKSDLRDIEFLLYHGKDSGLKDSIDQTDLANLDDYLLIPHPRYESDADNFYDDPFDSKGEKIKESKLLIDELDLPCDFLPYSEYDSFNSQDFSRDDDLPSPNNEDKDFDPPFYEPLFFKDVPNSMTLLPFSSENKEKVFKPGIYTSEKIVTMRVSEHFLHTKPDAALTWWNSQIRSLGPDAYSMTWEVIKKKMTDKYCPQGEIKKLEIELWNLKVKENNVSAYTERFQELTLICTKFVANETEKIDKYVSRLPDNIYGSVKPSIAKTSDETIKLANDLMDQKLHTFAERQSNNKRKADESFRNNHGHQQQAPKRQNVARV